MLINVYRNLTKVTASLPRGLYAVFIFVALLTFSWIPVQAYTPWNDWCAGENKLLLNLYQPANVIWCILDVASSLGIVGMFFLLHRKLTVSVKSTSHLRDVSESGSLSGTLKAEAPPKPKTDVSDSTSFSFYLRLLFLHQILVCLSRNVCSAMTKIAFRTTQDYGAACQIFVTTGSYFHHVYDHCWAYL